VTQYGQT